MTRRTLAAAVALSVLTTVMGPSATWVRADLKADELVLVVNANEPAGLDLARFYAAQRHVPPNRILSLDLPKGDEITPGQYARQVVPQVRAFLRDGKLEAKVKCLVTFYGVPLRIGGRAPTPAEQGEMADLAAQLRGLPAQMQPPVEAIESLAKRLDPAFVATTGPSLGEMMRRWATASAAIQGQLPTMPDADRQRAVTREYFAAAGPMLGTGGALTVRELDLKAHPDRRPIDGPPLAAGQQAYAAAQRAAAADEATPDDPAARAHLRQIARDQFGLFPLARLLLDEYDYLDPGHGPEAFDSELSLVHHKVHSYNFIGGDPAVAAANPPPPAVPGQPAPPTRPAWFLNPLFYAAPRGNPRTTVPTLMVTRLDAATPGLVKAIIATGVRVEQRGLRGKVAIDSMGLLPGKDAAHPGFGPYDQTLRDYHDLLGRSPAVRDKKLDVVFDDNDAILPAGSVSDVAVYVGWYAVNGYVPSCSFAGGAVAMHVASYTMVTLHPTGAPNWAPGLLADGAVATVGPVAEPYLAAFPRADDFFPLLMTGKLTLAECYWRTEPLAAWRMAIVGDPLYTPYRVNPPLAAADLPLRLHPLLVDPAAAAAARP